MRDKPFAHLVIRQAISRLAGCLEKDRHYAVCIAREVGKLLDGFAAHEQEPLPLVDNGGFAIHLMEVCSYARLNVEVGSDGLYPDMTFCEDLWDGGIHFVLRPENDSLSMKGERRFTNKRIAEKTTRRIIRGCEISAIDEAEMEIAWAHGGKISALIHPRDFKKAFQALDALLRQMYADGWEVSGHKRLQP